MIRARVSCVFVRCAPFISASRSEWNHHSSILPPSSSRPPLLGLTLLSLLSSSKIAEFHTLLETLDDEIVSDSYVKWPIDL